MPTTAAATTKPRAFLPFILLSSLLAAYTPVRPPRSDGRFRSIHNPRPPDKPERAADLLAGAPAHPLDVGGGGGIPRIGRVAPSVLPEDRKSTRLNSSH